MPSVSIPSSPQRGLLHNRRCSLGQAIAVICACPASVCGGVMVAEFDDLAGSWTESAPWVSWSASPSGAY